MTTSKFTQESNIEKTLEFSTTKLYEVYVENGEIKLPMAGESITIGYTAEYIQKAVELVNNAGVAYTRIEKDWYGDGSQIKFYGRDAKGFISPNNNYSYIMGWIDNKLKFLLRNQSPLSPTEKV